jgi:hypothetical protein
MTPRFSMRLEFELPDWHASDYAGGGRVANHIEAYSQREEGRSPSVSLLFGYNMRPVSRCWWSPRRRPCVLQRSRTQWSRCWLTNSLRPSLL